MNPCAPSRPDSFYDRGVLGIFFREDPKRPSSYKLTILRGTEKDEQKSIDSSTLSGLIKKCRANGHFNLKSISVNPPSKTSLEPPEADSFPTAHYLFILRSAIGFPHENNSY